MQSALRTLCALLVSAALLGGCTTPGGDGPPGPTVTPTPTESASCEPFGATGGERVLGRLVSPAADGPDQAIWGVTMAVSSDDCFDRFTFEFAAWYDGTPIDEPAFGGPEQILPTEPRAIEEVRVLGAFEGLSQIGIGLDQARPYRVTWLDDPKRLVVDVYIGKA